MANPVCLAPVRDIADELAAVRRACPELCILTPRDAAEIVDVLVAIGARRTVEGRKLLIRFGRVEEMGCRARVARAVRMIREGE